MIKTFILIISLSLMSLSCSKSDDSSPPPATTPSLPTPSPAPVVQDLSTKGLQEVLKLKYNKAVLECRLWVQSGQKLDPRIPANAELSWDLIHNYVPNKSFELSYIGQPQSVDLKILVTNVYIANGFFKASDGHTSDFKNSPVVDLRYSFAATPIQNNGVLVDDRGVGGASIYEKESQEVLSRSNFLAEFQVNALKYFECTIDTDIKPEYQNEFQVR